VLDHEVVRHVGRPPWCGDRILLQPGLVGELRATVLAQIAIVCSGRAIVVAAQLEATLLRGRCRGVRGAYESSACLSASLMTWGAPKWPPQSDQRSDRPGEPVAVLDVGLRAMPLRRAAGAAAAAAPIAVPTAAPVTKLSVAAFLVVMPADWSAHWRQAASSAWNCSKGFPVPGRTITLGPVGMVAQAPSSTASGAARRSDFI